MGSLDDNDSKLSGNNKLNAETRRIPKELIEKQIRMEAKKADNNKNEQANTENIIEKKEIQNRNPLQDSSKTMAMNTDNIRVSNLNSKSGENEPANTSGDKMQAISLDKTMPIDKNDVNKKLNNEEKKNLPNTTLNREMKLPKPPEEKSSITNWLIAGIVIIVVLIFFVIKSNKKDLKTDQVKNAGTGSVKNENVIESEIKDEADNNEIENVEEEPIEEQTSPNIVEKKPKLLDKIKIIDTLEISNENLRGKSLMKIRKKGAVFSEEIDPKIVAISDALKRRVEIISGVKTVKRGKLISKIWRGVFHKFKVDALLRKNNNKILTDKITVITPSKEQFTVINGVLYSVKRLKYESLIKDLKNNRITLIENPANENKILTVNLKVLPPKTKPLNNEFLVTSNGIFNIKAGDGIENISLNIPKGFGVIKKNIEIDEYTNYNIYKIHDPKFNTLLFIKGWKGRVEKIEITNSRIKTSEGIAVGSTFGNLRIYFETLKVVKTKNNVIVVINKEIDGYFVLDASSEDFDNGNIKDSSKIIEIVLE